MSVRPITDRLDQSVRLATSQPRRTALSDGAQSLYPEQFERLMGELRVIAPVLGRMLPLARVGSAAR